MQLLLDGAILLQELFARLPGIGAQRRLFLEIRRGAAAARFTDRGRLQHLPSPQIEAPP